MKIALGSDHAGLELKEDLKKFLDEKKISYKDFGTYDEKSCDYPDFTVKVCESILSGESDKGLLVCGSGIGMDITANKFKGIYSALVDNTYTAEMSRRHNNSNVIVMPGRLIGKTMARAILEKWLNTGYDGGRHENRLKKIKEIENKNFK